MGLWECLWACVSGGMRIVGGTVPYVGSGLCEKGGEEQHTVISLSFLIADAMQLAASSSHWLSFPVKMECTLYLWVFMDYKLE